MSDSCWPLKVWKIFSDIDKQPSRSSMSGTRSFAFELPSVLTPTLLELKCRWIPAPPVCALSTTANRYGSHSKRTKRHVHSSIRCHGSRTFSPYRSSASQKSRREHDVMHPAHARRPIIGPLIQAHDSVCYTSAQRKAASTQCR